MKEVGREAGGLYLLLHQLADKRKESALKSALVATDSSSTYHDSDMELWHKRLGHVSSTVLARIFDMNKQSLCKISKCLVCLYAKQTRVVFPTSSIKCKCCFYLIHIDLWGPYNTPTCDGNKYFLTIIDDFSRMTWLFLLKLKSDICVSLQVFLQYVKTQFGKVVKIIRTNNGTEFVNSICDQLFQDMGIVHQKTCPYTPQQNGADERKHTHILEVTRAMRFQEQVPLRYRGHCVLAATYVINRLLGSVINFQTPYERLYGTPPVLSHLRTLGCLCFAKDLSVHEKLMARSRMDMHMGYSEVQDGYILLDLSSKSFFTSRDV